MELRVELRGLGDFQYAMSYAPREYRSEAHRLIGSYATAAARQASRIAPVRTGRLRQSIRARALRELRWSVEAAVNYAGFIEFGTRPHLILPRRARVLRFFVAGEEAFALRAMHPGTAPRPFIRPAVEDVLPRLRSALARLYPQLLKRRFRAK